MKAGRIILRTIGLIALSALIAVVLCTAGFYVYLATGTFDAETAAATDTASASYGGTYQVENGSFTMDLTTGDVLYLLQQGAGMELADAVAEESPVKCSISRLAFTMGQDSLTAYADGTLLGFIHVHIRAEFDAVFDGSKLLLDLEKISIGPDITFTADDLLERGIAVSYAAPLPEGIGDFTLTDGGAVLKLPLTMLTDGTEGLIADAYPTARALYLFGADAGDNADWVQVLTAASLLEAPDGSLAAEQINAAEDPVESAKTLLALCTEEKENAYLTSRHALLDHFVLGDSMSGISDRRDALESLRLDAQAVYEKALTTARTKYQQLQMRVDKTGFTDLETETAASPEVFHTPLNGGEFISYCLIDANGVHAARVSDMPALSEVPFGYGLRVRFYTAEIADLGLYVSLPSGQGALLYYLEGGGFAVHFLDEADFRSLLSVEGSMLLEQSELPQEKAWPKALSGGGTAEDLYIVG